MSTNSVLEQLTQTLAARGAAIVACADLATLPADVRGDLRRGVCIGVPLRPEIVAEIGKGPTIQYAAEYDRVNAHACCQAAAEQSKKISFDGTICGRCIAACPHTREYLRRSLT